MNIELKEADYSVSLHDKSVRWFSSDYPKYTDDFTHYTIFDKKIHTELLDDILIPEITNSPDYKHMIQQQKIDKLLSLRLSTQAIFDNTFC